MMSAQSSFSREGMTPEALATAGAAAESTWQARRPGWLPRYGAVMLLASGLVAGCSGAESPGDGCRNATFINDLEKPDTGNPLLLTPGQIPFVLLLSRHDATSIGVGTIIGKKDDHISFASFMRADTSQINLKIPSGQTASTWSRQIGADTFEVIVTHDEVRSRCLKTAGAVAAAPKP
ncbi:MAG: hypothetical protein ABI602_03885 [Candidatus Saccharibacteria bacterium]